MKFVQRCTGNYFRFRFRPSWTDFNENPYHFRLKPNINTYRFCLSSRAAGPPALLLLSFRWSIITIVCEYVTVFTIDATP